MVKIFNFEGQEMSRHEPYNNFLQGNSRTAIATTAFHPHQMLLGCAARGDNHINLFACGNEKVGSL